VEERQKGDREWAIQHNGQVERLPLENRKEGNKGKDKKVS